MRRRDFIKRGAASVVVASLGVNRSSLFGQDSEAAAQPGPNDKIVLGFIGMGRMGQSNLETFLKHPDVEVAAVCDVYSPNLDAALKITKGKAKALKDFRRVLDMKEVQAVVVCSPDHWHPLQTILACEAGKDVYVEKPISLYLREGRRMIQAGRTH